MLVLNVWNVIIGLIRLYKLLGLIALIILDAHTNLSSSNLAQAEKVCCYLCLIRSEGWIISFSFYVIKIYNYDK